MTTQYSTVKWFDAKKGYGFINHPDGGDDVFIHYSQIESDDDFKTLRTGQSVQFEMNDGPKGLHAVNVQALDDGQSETNGVDAAGVASEPARSESAPVDPATADPAPAGAPPAYADEDDAGFDSTSYDYDEPDYDDSDFGDSGYDEGDLV